MYVINSKELSDFIDARIKLKCIKEVEKIGFFTRFVRWFFY